MTRQAQQALTLFLVALLILGVGLLTAQLIILSEDQLPRSPTASSTATVGVCIATPPYWLDEPECLDAFAGTPYTCNVSAQHDTHNVTEYSASVLSGNPNGTSLFNNISTQGILSFNASSDQAGNYTVEITAYANSTCQSPASIELNFTVIDTDQAPIFNGPIPNSTWDANTILIPYNLNNYFTDPQGWPLAYRAEGNSHVAVEINPSSGEVTLRPAEDWCGTEVIQYIATNPANLTAESNFVTLKVENCPSEQQTTPQQPATGGGGGGGGGGAAASCVEDFYCYDWSSCQYTKAISRLDNRSIEIEGVRGTREYQLQEELHPDGEEIFYQGYQWRECIDTRMCTDRRLVYARTCEYEPTCDDGIQNQGETGVDCGGPNCAPCHSCNDGIQNGLETGVDCGGPDCEPCHSCNDGIMNGLETGVDCGGPDCPPCEDVSSMLPEEQEPGVVTPVITTLLLGALIATVGFVLAVIFARKYVIKALAAYALKYQRKNRVVLLSEEDKRFILSELASLDNERGALDAVVVQQRVARITRSYFMRAFDLEFEFTQEDLASATTTVQDSLAELLEGFFARIQEVEFSKDAVRAPLLESLIGEVEQLVYQTSVLSVEELRLFEEPLDLAQPATGAGAFEQLIISLSNAQRAVASGRAVLGRELYAQVHKQYEALSGAEQRLVHPEVKRLFLALLVEEFKQRSLLFLRQKRN